MGKILVFAEKPSAGREYINVLKKEGNFQRKNGYEESDKYIVTWGVGHLLSAKQPQDYKEFGGWNWESIPFYPPSGNLDYKANPSTKDQLNAIQQLLKRSDIDKIINGGDPGREGELIFWLIYNYCKCKLPVERLWVSTLTEEEIAKGFKSLRQKDFYAPRREAAYARQYADWALGMNLTVGFSIKANMGRALHIGRVQTPTIAILVNRKQEIENFKPEDYFEIDAEFGGKYKGQWFKDQLGNTRFKTKEEAQAIVDMVTGKRGKVISKEVNEMKENPKKLYSLGALQVDADKKYGIAPGDTLKLAQELYETYKVLSYPRTDSEFLSKAFIPELEPTLKAIQVGDYKPFVDHVLAGGIKGHYYFINDKKVSDHHAIVPTKLKVDTSKFADDRKKGITADDLKKVFDLVARRFLAAFYPAAVYEKTEIVTESEGETFKTSGRILVDAGWKAVYGKEADETEDEKGKDQDKTLPPIEKDEENEVTNTELHEKVTKPPSHYTRGDLVQILKEPTRLKKLFTDEELQDMIMETAGLGTEATRSGILDNIVARGYAEISGSKKTKYIVATPLAEKLISIAPDSLKSPEVTAEWEQKLKQIADEELDSKSFEDGIRNYVVSNIEELKEMKLDVSFSRRDDKPSVGKCPKCGEDVFEFQKVFACASNTREHSCFAIFKNVAGKTITIKQAQDLMTKGETGIIKGFKSNKGTKFDAKLKIIDGKVQFAFDQSEPKETDLTCPKCSGKIIDKGRLFSCENSTTEKPCLAIFKTIAGKTIDLKVAKALIEKGETEVLSGFKSSKGKPFQAKLVLTQKGVEFNFDSNPAPQASKDMGIACPICGDGHIVENAKAFGCSNWKEKGCTFSVWKVMSGKTITETIVKELAMNKKTEKLEGFKSSKGQAFSAALEVDMKQKKVVFNFQ